MTDEKSAFSSRRGYDPFDVPVRVHEGAPPEIRRAVLHFALNCGLSAEESRRLILRTLTVPPEPDNWSADSNIVNESQRHLEAANWYEVYDIAEAFAAQLERHHPETLTQYTESLNKAFARYGVGWKMASGRVEARGSEAFETNVARARQELAAVGFSEAAKEMRESLRDLSRRPEPDLTGAVHHSIGALEAVAREVTALRSSTLGQILKAEKGLFPPPLGDALEKVWGFASDKARHLREGDTVEHAEAELLVGLAASAVTYLCSKLSRSSSDA